MASPTSVTVPLVFSHRLTYNKGVKAAEDADLVYDFLEELEEELGDEDWEVLEHLDRSNPSSTQTIHDQLQFQADFDFDLIPSIEGEKQKVYRVDSYFFFPTSMGIDRETFSREQFYASMTHYLRIRTPALPQDSEETGLLPAADRYFRVHLLGHLRQPLESLVIQEVKLLGCYLNTQFKRLLRYQRALFLKKEPSHLEHRLKMQEALLVKTLHILGDFRQQYMGKIRYQSYLVDQEVNKAFLLVDEYLSFRLEATLIKLLQRLQRQAVAERLQELLRASLHSEMEYRSAEGLLCITENSNIAIRENYYYRLGLLKKYVSDVLYLQVKNIRKDKTYRNMVAAAGAALAALWAGLIDLQRFYFLSHTEQELVSDFALRFFMIVIVGMIAYIFKDRIKELSREFFYERLKQYMPDFDFDMVYPFYDEVARLATDLRVGKTRQFMRFLSRDALAAEIRYIRELGHRTALDPERNEEVLHFSQTLTLDTEQISQQSEQIQTLHNIMRFNVSPFLEKMDDPNKNLRYYTPDAGIQMIKAPKVYHLNVIIRHISYCLDQYGEASPEQVDFERIRLILDKQGIQRIEPVLPRGALGYVEEKHG